MTSQSLYIPQSDGIEVEDIETIQFIAYPELLELSFDDVVVLETESIEWN